MNIFMIMLSMDPLEEVAHGNVEQVGLRPPGGPENVKQIEKNGTDLGWFGDDFGTVWERFRDAFGLILKNRKFESSELKN